MSKVHHIIRNSAVALATLAMAHGAWAQADEARAKKIAGGSCFLCHGANGESTSEAFPRLAGQHAGYIEQQLKLFRAGHRGNSPMMNQIADRMSDSDIKAVSDYAAGLR